YWWKNRTPEAPPVEEAPAEVMAPPAADPEPEIAHPLAETPPDTTAPPLPSLAESDGPLALEMGMLFGTESVTSYLEPQNVTRRLVATIDGLPRAHGLDRLRPVKPVTPTFAVDRHPPTSPTAEERIFVSENNAARYVPLVTLLEATDTKLIAALYQRWYPLMQQSYEDLGFPGRYFNDRVVSVIDHLLETPTVKGPIELTQPNVLFEYADPQIEALSSGQKLLIRMGPENATKVKAKLKELRVILGTQPKPAVKPATTL
ncbi:MAG: DUF3014 domain-containing protein, partial [Steroidobacteraceae bacterium]